MKILLEVKKKLQSLLKEFLTKANTKEKSETEEFYNFYSNYQRRLHQELYMLGISSRIDTIKIIPNISEIYKLDFLDKRIIMKTLLSPLKKGGAILRIMVEGKELAWDFKSLQISEILSNIISESVKLIKDSFNLIDPNFPIIKNIIPSLSYRGKDAFIIVGNNLKESEHFSKSEIYNIILDYVIFEKNEKFSIYKNFHLIFVSNNYWSLFASS